MFEVYSQEIKRRIIVPERFRGDTEGTQRYINNYISTFQQVNAQENPRVLGSVKNISDNIFSSVKEKPPEGMSWISSSPILDTLKSFWSGAVSTPTRAVGGYGGALEVFTEEADFIRSTAKEFQEDLVPNITDESAFLTSIIPSGLGQYGSMLAIGAAAGSVIPGVGTATGMGIATMAVALGMALDEGWELVDEAEDLTGKVTTTKKLGMMATAVPIAASNLFVVGKALNRINKATGGHFFKHFPSKVGERLNVAIPNLVEEGLQEAGETIGWNAAAKGILDLEKGLFDDAVKAGAAGGVVAGIAGMVLPKLGSFRIKADKKNDEELVIAGIKNKELYRKFSDANEGLLDLWAMQHATNYDDLLFLDKDMPLSIQEELIKKGS